MRIAITGGAGFLGYHLANRLAPQGIEVVLLDIAEFDPSKYPDNVSSIMAYRRSTHCRRQTHWMALARTEREQGSGRKGLREF